MPHSNSKRRVGPTIARAIRCALPFVMLLMLTGPLGAAAEESEAKIKVAFLFNFAKFVSWPEPEFSAQPTITICVSGESTLDNALNVLKGKSAQGRDVIVKRDVKLGQLAHCHVVFICSSESTQVPKNIETRSAKAF